MSSENIYQATSDFDMNMMMFINSVGRAGSQALIYNYTNTKSGIFLSKKKKRQIELSDSIVSSLPLLKLPDSFLEKCRLSCIVLLVLHIGIVYSYGRWDVICS